MRPFTRSLPLLAAALIGCAGSRDATRTPPRETVRWSATAVPGATPGTEVVHVVGNIVPGWHIYSITQPAGGPVPTRVTLPAGQPFEQDGAIRSSPPRVAHDSAFGMQVKMHEGQATFDIPVRATGAPAAAPVRVAVRYQACSETLCLPPQTAHLAAAPPAAGTPAPGTE